MNSEVTQKIIKTSTIAQAERILAERRAHLLKAIGDRTIEPTAEIMLELSEINIALGDVEDYPGVQS